MNHAKMQESSLPQPEAPRFENGRALIVAGMKERFNAETMKNIPGLWQRFAPNIGRIPGQVGHVAYGLCSNLVPSPLGFDYMAGVEVSSAAGLPEGFARVHIPEFRYAIFAHREHLSSLKKTIDGIWGKWLPASGEKPARVGRDEPYMLERYGEGFDPVKGMGDIELRIPLEG
jgi:AraC family transcriptional regulator